MRDVVPLVQQAEALVMEARRLHHEKRVGIETFVQLMEAWAQLSGVVSSVSEKRGSDICGSRPADRAESALHACSVRGQATRKVLSSA